MSYLDFVGIVAVFLLTSITIYFIIRNNELKRQLAEAKQIKTPSTDLKDFLSDIRRHGYGVVRIDPDNLNYRLPWE